MSYYDNSPLRARIGDSTLARRLSGAIQGEVLFDAFNRGRYSTDASIYQIEPVGVVVPEVQSDLDAVIAIAAEEGIPLLPRGAGTSQSGQTVGLALVVDVSKHLNSLIHLDLEESTVTVEPGIVLDQLNAGLKRHGLFFPVDVSTASRATIGGMAGNNSCGARSVRYGLMRDNVLTIDALLANGDEATFGPVPDDLDGIQGPAFYRQLTRSMVELADRESKEITSRFPKVHRRVGGYNIDALMSPGTGESHRNMAQLLVGSEGTLAFTRRLTLRLQPIPEKKILGICHFSSFYAAMASTQHIMKLSPDAVELVDQTLIELALEIPMFRDTLTRYVRGRPKALLLVEFAGQDPIHLERQLADLGSLLSDLGHSDSVVKITDAGEQRAVWDVRKAGLNIMMSMKGDGKPVSFIEDCAVPLEHLADFTDRLTGIFRDHGTSGTWYAHASEGCLHVRPILNMKSTADVKKMRSIAEKAFAMVREYGGSHSGEHGDGIVRSEFHPVMFGDRMLDIFGDIKQAVDPKGLFNPGKIVQPPKMDDRSLFRYRPDYDAENTTTHLDWSDWGGFAGAVEMCNNNGACRKRDAAVMCPSYRATGDEQHSTRGRANALRLALSGQLGPGALTSDAMHETLSLCVGCKACKRECPTGVDMARMKMELQAMRVREVGLTAGQRLVAYLPRYAPRLAPFAGLLNSATSLPVSRRLLESLTGLTRHRALPLWQRDPGLERRTSAGPARDTEVVVLLDTFTRWFEPANGQALVDVLSAAGCHVHIARPKRGRPLCCGRTFLSAGLIDQARTEATRLIKALRPYLDRGIPLVGLEPACLLTLRDEYKDLFPSSEAEGLDEMALLLEEYLVRNHTSLSLDFGPSPISHAALHCHCHQKAFDTAVDVETVLGWIPDLQVDPIASSCCGMAGDFGQWAQTYAVSMNMAELSLLPAVRNLAPESAVVAGGTSCRQQIRHGTGRDAIHFVQLLRGALTAKTV
jgi:FAD/FMN-containing dehydrogenase/Fe-S oxidoreductase